MKWEEAQTLHVAWEHGCELCPFHLLPHSWPPPSWTNKGYSCQSVSWSSHHHYSSCLPLRVYSPSYRLFICWHESASPPWSGKQSSWVRDLGPNPNALKLSESLSTWETCISLGKGYHWAVVINKWEDVGKAHHRCSEALSTTPVRMKSVGTESSMQPHRLCWGRWIDVRELNEHLSEEGEPHINSLH